ncbi:hypothetical protein AB0B79_38100 [Streptomyces sp. NPDC039022]|uniref:STAS domain-containing protein n=1 Tax=Streptomyces sp. NPDC039022 TaxID=3157091 RepID=UPI0033F87594
MHCCASGTPTTHRLRLSGQINLPHQTALMGHLLAVNGAPADVTLDLRKATFMNFAALHALVSYTEMLGPGRRLALHTRTPVVGQMLAGLRLVSVRTSPGPLEKASNE